MYFAFGTELQAYLKFTAEGTKSAEILKLFNVFSLLILRSLQLDKNLPQTDAGVTGGQYRPNLPIYGIIQPYYAGPRVHFPGA